MRTVVASRTLAVVALLLEFSLSVQRIRTGEMHRAQPMAEIVSLPSTSDSVHAIERHHNVIHISSIFEIVRQASSDESSGKGESSVAANHLEPAARRACRQLPFVVSKALKQGRVAIADELLKASTNRDKE